MSVEWVLGILLAAQAGLLSFYIHHIVACNKRDRDRAAENLQITRELAAITEALKRMQTDIGTHETGLRGQLHRLSNDIGPMIVMERLKRQQEKNT